MPDRSQSSGGLASSPTERDPHRLLGFRLPLLANIWSALAARRFARLLGLKQLEARVLFVVGINDAVSLKSLGQSAGIEKAYASRTTASLVESGMIEKVVDPDDRRAVRLRLTVKGRGLFDALLAETNARDDEWIGVLNASERRNLHNYLDRLGMRLSELAEADRTKRRK